MVGMASFGYWWLAGWWIQLVHRLHLGVKSLINDIYYYDKKNYISLYGIMPMRAETLQCMSLVPLGGRFNSNRNGRIIELSCLYCHLFYLLSFCRGREITLLR